MCVCVRYLTSSEHEKCIPIYILFIFCIWGPRPIKRNRQHVLRTKFGYLLTAPDRHMVRPKRFIVFRNRAQFQYPLSSAYENLFDKDGLLMATVHKDKLTKYSHKLFMKNVYWSAETHSA